MFVPRSINSFLSAAFFLQYKCKWVRKKKNWINWTDGPEYVWSWKSNHHALGSNNKRRSSCACCQATISGTPPISSQPRALNFELNNELNWSSCSLVGVPLVSLSISSYFGVSIVLSRGPRINSRVLLFALDILSAIKRKQNPMIKIQWSRRS